MNQTCILYSEQWTSKYVFPIAIIEYNIEKWVSEYEKSGEQVKILHEYERTFSL